MKKITAVDNEYSDYRKSLNYAMAGFQWTVNSFLTNAVNLVESGAFSGTAADNLRKFALSAKGILGTQLDTIVMQAEIFAENYINELDDADQFLY